MPTSSDARFGLPLSLAEALRQDPSPQAAELATLLEAEPPRLRRAAHACRAAGARLAVGLTGLAAGLSLAGHALAAGPSMVGRWVLAPAASQFSEAVTGAAPDKVVVTVTRDDDARFAYRVDETRAGAPVAHASYAVTYGGPSTSRVDGATLSVRGERAPSGDVVIRAPAVDGLQAVIRVHRLGAASAVIEHAVEGPAGAATLERLDLARETVASAD